MDVIGAVVKWQEQVIVRLGILVVHQNVSWTAPSKMFAKNHATFVVWFSFNFQCFSTRYFNFHSNVNWFNFFYWIGAPSEYPIAGFNRQCSETGYERIVGLNRCQMVARMMKKSFSVAKTWKDYPNGCYIFSDNRVYFNHHLTGQSNELACPICYRPGSSGSRILLKNV